MAWDFSTDPEWQQELDWIERFCREEIEPVSLTFPGALVMRNQPAALTKHLDGLKQQVKDRGLWGIFLDKHIGGPGFGQLKLALVNEILGRYGMAPAIFGCQAPDTGNMDIIARYGTDEQKEKYLVPLFEQRMRSCYSMTEPQGGSDTRGFLTHAEKQDDGSWVINGEKWFSSFGKTADILIVMCNNGMFIVEQGTPGIEFLHGAGIHAHIRYNNVHVPASALLGPEGGAHSVAQFRLGGGRIHHAMRAVAQVKLALDMMCERVISRESRGHLIADYQMVQNDIAESYMQVEMLRLLVLQTAWKIDNTDGRATRADIGACKIMAAKTIRDVVYRAHHIHGALGTTDLTPLQGMWASAPYMSMMDGPDEVHKVVIAKEVLKNYEPHEGLFPREYIPAKKAAAREKLQGLIDSDPELKEHVAQMDRYAEMRANAGV